MNAELIICNRSYKLECSDEQFEPLNRAAAVLNTKLAELRKSHPYLENERLAVLAALDICQDLLALEQQTGEFQQVRKMISRLSDEAARVLGAGETEASEN